MTDPNIAAAYAAILVGGLADHGSAIAFVSPGSRNTPLTLAIAREPRTRDFSFRDERSGAFAALGYAKATGTPAIVVCTSGSAGAHYLAAIIEADQSQTPLIVLTADRPRRLRGTGAPQTTDQTDLYGSHVKTSLDIEPTARQAGRRDAEILIRAAMETPKGPVHANIAFDEPLLPTEIVQPADPQPVSDVHDASSGPADLFAELKDRSVMIVVGGRGGGELSHQVGEAAARLGAPVFADPRANVTGRGVLSHGDLIVGALHDGQPLALMAQPPDVVLRLGPIPTSKPMWQWLEHSGVDQILIDATRLTDPLKSAATVVNADPLNILSNNPTPVNSDHSFLDAWLAVDEKVSASLQLALAVLPFPNEPQVAATVVASVPRDSVLFVASSRPIRDVDAFAIARPDVRVIANRGVNGIDGTISTAIGVALSGTPTTLLIGDVAALHDVTALSEAARLGVPLRVVVVNNDGGGIFSFLPQATSSVVSAETYEHHWGTPHGLALAPIASAMGVRASTLTTKEALARAVATTFDDPELVEIVTDRSANVRHHDAIRSAVGKVVAAWAAEEAG